LAKEQITLPKDTQGAPGVKTGARVMLISQLLKDLQHVAR
jgi:hypothetical protein